jgi:hypothetical protein
MEARETAEPTNAAVAMAYVYGFGISMATTATRKPTNPTKDATIVGA